MASEFVTTAKAFLILILLQIFNKGNVCFGDGEAPMRQAKIRVSMSPEDGRLRSPTNVWVSSADIIVPPITAKNSVTMKQILRIAMKARPYKHIKVNLALYISPAGLTIPETNSDVSRMQLIQSHEVTMQIAPGHVHGENSDVLIVTNADTTRNQYEALRNFVEDTL